MGGVDSSIQQVRQAIDNKEYNWAAELATYVIVVDSENDEAKLLKAYALRIIGQQMLSVDARHWALTSALELEGKIIIDSNAFSQTSPEQLSELPIEKILKALPTKLDSEKLDTDGYVLNVIYTDTNQEFTLHFRNGVLAVISGLNSSEDNTITLDTVTHKQIVGGHLTLMDAIDKEQIISDGDIEDLEYFLGLIDPLT